MFTRDKLNKMRLEAYKFDMHRESHRLANLLIEHPNLTGIVRVKEYDDLKYEWEYSGHGAFGEAEHTRHEYIYINNKKVRVYDSEYLFLDGKNVIKATYDSVIGISLEELSEKLVEKFKETIA